MFRYNSEYVAIITHCVNSNNNSVPIIITPNCNIIMMTITPRTYVPQVDVKQSQTQILNERSKVPQWPKQDARRLKMPTHWPN